MIGGGPAGLIAAREAAKMGVEVTVFEEHSEIGEPEKCAGLLSLSGLKRIGVPTRGPYLQNLVRGAVIWSVTGRRYLIDSRLPVAAVVDRKLFDQVLAKQAEKAGAKILCGNRVKRVNKCGSIFSLTTTKGNFHSEWVIDAEGAGASILRNFLKAGTNSNKWIPAIQLIVEGHNLDKRFVYIYFKRYLPHFFSYLVPINDDLGKLGVASRIPDLRSRLKKFLVEEFSDVRIISKSSHVLYTGSPVDSHLMFPLRFIPVGDAAGHVKATTGGGVIMGGLISANIALAIAEELKGGFSGKFLARSEDIIRELKRIAIIRNLIKGMNSITLALFLELALSKLIKVYLSRSADMDFQASSILKLKHNLY